MCGLDCSLCASDFIGKQNKHGAFIAKNGKALSIYTTKHDAPPKSVPLFLFEMCNFFAGQVFYIYIYIYILCICLYISYIHAVMLYRTVICLHIFGVSQVLMFIDFWDDWNYLRKLNSGRFP